MAILGKGRQEQRSALDHCWQWRGVGGFSLPFEILLAGLRHKLT